MWLLSPHHNSMLGCISHKYTDYNQDVTHVFSTSFKNIPCLSSVYVFLSVVLSSICLSVPFHPCVHVHVHVYVYYVSIYPNTIL